MKITGVTMFKIFYAVIILFHVCFIAYSLLNNKELVGGSYIMLASTSVVLLSIVLIVLEKNKPQK